MLDFFVSDQYAGDMNEETKKPTQSVKKTQADTSNPTPKTEDSKKGKRVLIADDEQYIRELYQEVLQDEGYEVEAVGDGETALTKISEGGWDLITLDVIMPKLDGLGVLTKLQESPPKKKNGPIVLLTSLANDPAVKEAQDKGATEVIIKTEITPKQFVEMVKKTIG